MSFTSHQATAYNYTASAPTGDAYTLAGGPSKVFGTADGDNCVRAVHQQLYKTKDYVLAGLSSATNIGGLWFIPTNTPPDFSPLDEYWSVELFFDGTGIAAALLGSGVLPTDEYDFIPSPDWTDITEYPWLSDLHEDEITFATRLGYARMIYHPESGSGGTPIDDQTQPIVLTKFRARWATASSGASSPPTFHGTDFYPALLWEAEITLPAWSYFGSTPSPWTTDPGILYADNASTYSSRDASMSFAMDDRTLAFDGNASSDFGAPATGVTAVPNSSSLFFTLTPDDEFPYTP